LPEKQSLLLRPQVVQDPLEAVEAVEEAVLPQAAVVLKPHLLPRAVEAVEEAVLPQAVVPL
jgi:hypothetical protein